MLSVLALWLLIFQQQVTKAEVENAIQNGAKTLKDIQEITGAYTSNHCKELNPLGFCCSGDINSMFENTLKEITPVVVANKKIVIPLLILPVWYLIYHY